MCHPFQLLMLILEMNGLLIRVALITCVQTWTSLPPIGRVNSGIVLMGNMPCKIVGLG